MSIEPKTRFTMHSNAHFVLRKKAVTMPFGIGVFGIYIQTNQPIHLFINQINSL